MPYIKLKVNLSYEITWIYRIRKKCQIMKNSEYGSQYVM